MLIRNKVLLAALYEVAAKRMDGVLAVTTITGLGNTDTASAELIPVVISVPVLLVPARCGRTGACKVDSRHLHPGSQAVRCFRSCRCGAVADLLLLYSWFRAG
jgi:hypothetical protein